MQVSMLTPAPNLVKSEHFPACYRIPGAQGGEAERAQPRHQLRGLQPRWNQDRVELERPDDQSLGCRYLPALLHSTCSHSFIHRSKPTRSRLTDSFQLVEERKGDGSAFDNSGSSEVAERDGETLRLKEGGTFYAQNPLQCIAVHWPRLVAGAQSGELYHLEVQE